MSDLLFDDDVEEIEATPSAPNVPQPPATNVNFIGYTDVEQRIVTAINTGRMPHAIILAGEAGRGKETFAYRLARALLSTRKTWPADDLSVTSDDPVISQLAQAAHPDCSFVRRRNKKTKDELSAEIVIDTVRESIGFMAMKPVAGLWRIVIVDEAHLMNEEAQNAFLKTLEEPPAHTVLILIADQVARLLPTIRSRAQMVNFPPLPPTILFQEGGAALRALSKETQDVLLRLSHGGIGALKQVLQPTILEGIDKIRTLMDDPEGVFGFSETWGAARLDGGMDPMLLLENVLIDHVQTKLRLHLDDDEVNKDRCFDAIDALQSLFTTARTKYLDKRQVIRQAFKLL